MDDHSKKFMQEFQTFLSQNTTLPSVITDNYDIYNCLLETDEKAVYLIHSKSTNELFVLKTCSVACKENIADEYKLLKSLNHDAVVRAVFYFEQDGYRYLIREYIEGKTLARIVEEDGPFDDKEAANIALQICGILRYLHLHQPPIIHRDIKPENVIYTEDHKCKLIDFGTSRRYHSNAQRDTTCLGTQNTAAPEQFGYKQTSAKTDIYSTGVLLLYLLTGTFDIDRRSSIKNKTLSKIVDKCVRFDPEARYTTTSHLIRSLKLALLRGSKVFRAACAGGVLVLAIILVIVGMSVFADHGKANMALNTQPSSKVSDIAAVSPDTIKPVQSDAAAQTEGIDEEISEAVGYGIVPDDIQGDWNDTITYRQYCTMIGNMLALKGSSYADQWETEASQALNSDQQMKRQEGMLALFFGAEILGETDSSGNWVALNNRIGVDCWSDFSWDYPLFPDWIDKAYYFGDYWNDHMVAAYFFAMDARIATSDKRIFDYDKASNSMLPKDPLTRRDAIHSVLRLYESTF